MSPERSHNMRKKQIAACMLIFTMILSACGNNEAATALTETDTNTVEASVSEPEQQDEKEEAPAPDTVEEGKAIPLMVDRLSKEATTNTISDEVKAKAQAMPEASYDNLPYWCGTTLSCKTGAPPEGLSSTYKEETVKDMASEGFNFVRVPIDTLVFFNEVEGKTSLDFSTFEDKVNTKQLANMDEFIGWCIENGIHACIDVHHTPGGNMRGNDEEMGRKMLFTEGSKEEQFFFNFWEFFSQRYADISPNALSFDIYNEPPQFVEQDQYVTFIKKAIAAIRPANPDRIIFVDMLDYASVPVYGLEDEKIVQAFHCYRPSEFTHSGYGDSFGFMGNDANRASNKRVKVTYPVPAISVEVGKGYEVKGDFKAGTKLTMGFSGGAAGVECILIDDQGKELWSNKFDDEYISSKHHEIHDGERFSVFEDGDEKLIYERYTLESDTSGLFFKLKNNNHWLDMNELVVETDNYKALLVGMWIEGVESNLPATKAAIDENGLVTITDPAASKYDMGREYLENVISEYVEFSKKTGTQIMLHEFGSIIYTDITCTCRCYDDLLSICQENGIGWAHYEFEGGEFSYASNRDHLRRNDATYEPLPSGDADYCVEIREVFRKHMD